MTRWLNLAFKTAKKSKHNKYKMAAVVISGGRVVSVAANGAKIGAHAERRALAKALQNAKGGTILVVRSDGGPSLPCKHCQALIESARIRRIVAYDRDRNVVVKGGGS